MNVAIDNLDGLGAVDYSDQLMAEGPLTIERELNKPSTCRWTMRDGLTRPARLGRVIVTSNRGVTLFTGYLTREPQTVYAGEGVSGTVYRVQVEATSDDWLLDKQGLRVNGVSFAESGDALLRSLTSRVDGSRFTTSATGVISQVGGLQTSSAKSWSENAAGIADAAGASYRVVSGEVQIAPLGSTVHTFTTADDSLSERGLTLATTRELANDVTIFGELEAGTSVTEIFVGDGTTSEFALAAAPFSGGSTASRTLVSDDFSAGVIDRQRWAGGDPGSHLSVGAGGLILSGGNGLDGQTTLIAQSAAELSGVLLLEAKSVTLGQGSDGVLLGLYNGVVSRATCVAGLDVRQLNGATTLACLVNGTSAGTAVTLASGHVYTLRIYVQSVQTQRVRQSYVVMVGGALQQFGGGAVDAPLSIVATLEDLGVASNTPATVLYDGSVASSPGSATFAPVNSVQLFGTVGEVVAEQLAPVWVRGRTSAGAAVTRLSGATGTGADFSLASGGTIRFFPGRVPAAGEQVTVQYRQGQRAVARVQSAASLLAEAKGGLPGEAVWQGRVLDPIARSAEDCAAAASALLSVAASRAEAVAGTYITENLADTWPGDRAIFVTANGATPVTVRRVRLIDGLALPELVRWQLEMANDWAECASIKVSTVLPTDAGYVSAGSGSSTVEGLFGLQLVSISTSAIQIDTGVVAPSGGGFEVRRSDGSFGPGQSGDLVLRSLVRGITLPRSAQVERFYVRMYDGSTPPVYSRLSSAIVTNVPVG